MFSFFKKKENIHEMNFKAQFANFRKKYSEEISAQDLDKYGKQFGDVIDEVESKVLKLVRDPKTQVADDINYWETTVDQILMTLVDKVECGRYVYRGMPAYETKYFVAVYKKIVNDMYNDGMINAEEQKIALNNMAEVVKTNG